MGKKLRYPISTFIAAFMLLRCYLLFRLFTRFTKWRTSLADRCCMKIGIEADTAFALKCSYKDKPFYLLSYAFMISSIVLGLAVRLFER